MRFMTYLPKRWKEYLEQAVSETGLDVQIVDVPRRQVALYSDEETLTPFWNEYHRLKRVTLG